MISFYKMHGLGNDFVIVNHDSLDFHYTDESFIKFVRSISDRRFGIGCFQFILFHRIDEKLFHMNIYNQNGNYAKACGNGSRCLALFISKEFGVFDPILQIGEQNISCLVSGLVEVNMGKPNFNPPWVPDYSEVIKYIKMYELDINEIYFIDVANPHLVLFAQKWNMEDMSIIGKEMQNLIPGGINVNFVKIEDHDIYLKVWERGVGFTLACGSGACASFAVAYNLNFIQKETKVIFDFGTLYLRMQNNEMLMRGDAQFVASGVFYYSSNK